MILVPLNKKQRELVRKVALIQLDAISDLIEDNFEEGAVLYCLKNDLDEDDFQVALRDQLRVWTQVKLKPCTIGFLDIDNISIMKTLLFRYFDKPKYKKAKYRIWKKLDVIAEYPLNLN
jgi:hypothetical protein